MRGRVGCSLCIGQAGTGRGRMAAAGAGGDGGESGAESPSPAGAAVDSREPKTARDALPSCNKNAAPSRWRWMIILRCDEVW